MPRLLVCWTFAAAVGAATLGLLAQYQVNRQIYGGPTAASVRYAPQYLGGQATAPRTSNLLPSELRNAYVRSGALPSDIRYGYNTVGPLAPRGAISYIPQGPSIPTGAAAGPQGNLVNPMVRGVGSFPAAPVTPFATSTNSSIRYGGAPVGAMVSVPPAGVGINNSVLTGAPNRSVSPNPYVGTVPSTFSPSVNPFGPSIRYNN
jgi:hypothetical protein